MPKPQATEGLNDAGDEATDRSILVCRLGQMSFEAAWSLQRALREKRERDELPNLLLLVEHPPTYTLGRSANPDHLLADADRLKEERGIAVFEIERGGSATYHGPGQLVGYPIVDLRPRGRDVHRFIRQLEQVLIGTLDAFGLPAQATKGLTGVWVGERKIASIGIHVRRWITMHGFALNVSPDLGNFQWIQPCGLDSGVITSMEELLAEDPGLEKVADETIRHFAAAYDCDSVEVDVGDLLATTATRQ